MITPAGRWIPVVGSTDLFSLGVLRITPFANALMDNATIATVMHRHGCGQWCHPDGLLAPAQEDATERSLILLQRGARTGDLLSRYRVRTRQGNTVDIAVITTVRACETCTWICLWMER